MHVIVMHPHVQGMLIASVCFRHVHCILMFKFRTDLEHEAEYAKSQSAQNKKTFTLTSGTCCKSKDGDGVSVVMQSNSSACKRTTVWSSHLCVAVL